MVRSCNPIAEVRGALPEIVRQLFVHQWSPRLNERPYHMYIGYVFVALNKMPQPERNVENWGRGTDKWPMSCWLPA